MNRRHFLAASATAGICASLSQWSFALTGQQTSTAREWIDPISKKRILRLSDIDNSKSLYFHDNAFSPDSRYMVMNSPAGISIYDFKAQTSRLLVTGNFEAIMVSRQKPICYARKYTGEFKGKDNSNLFPQVEYYTIEIPSGKTKFLGIFEQGFITSINADDTLMAGAYATRHYELQPGPKVANTDGGYNALDKNGNPMSFAAAKEVRMADRLNQNIPMEIFTIDLKTGERRVVTTSTDWLNHVQFSPTDPNKLMYCHEGPWHMVDRIWTIDIDGKNKTPIHRRTMNMEIAGHEFFSNDGKSIYYDLQTPRGEDFWLAKYDTTSKQSTWYHLDRNEWSVHYQISPNGKLFAGDGGDSEMVAKAPDGKYIYLFEPEIIEDLGVSAPDAAQLVRPGKLRSTKLVDMSSHDYRVEPNIQFSPDNKYLVFRSNMQGAIHVYAVVL